MKNKIYFAVVLAVSLFALDSCKKNGGQDIAVITDIDGNQYKTITLGTQTWMSRNLETTHYADSTLIPNGAGAGDLRTNDTSSFYFLYNNNTLNLTDYGRLYNWSAVMRGATGTNASPSGVQGPCPNGWHVPSEAEFATLINYLGGAAQAGGKMKGNADWEGGNVGAGNDVSGFNALPAGQRIAQGLYQEAAAQCYIWTTTDSSSAVAYMKVLNNLSAGITDSTATKGNGYTCRCLKN